MFVCYGATILCGHTSYKLIKYCEFIVYPETNFADVSFKSTFSSSKPCGIVRGPS